MNEYLDHTGIVNAMQDIEEDYKICLRIIGRFFDYLDTCGLKEFNKYSQYKWTHDRDKSNGYSYVCIRYGSSMIKKVLIKKRPYIESDDLYKWVQKKDIIQEALDEAYQYIVTKISDVKIKLEAIKETAENYEEKLDGLFDDYESAKLANKRLGDG